MTPALSVTQLTKIYTNGKTALKGIDLNVEQGDFFALLGQNGAGKSTTIGIISSLIKKTSGNVRVFDYDIDQQSEYAKSMIGIVPQEMNFNTFTPAIKILLNQAGYYGVPRHIAATRAERYLTEMSLWEVRNQPPMRLSGGMKRRLMIARALMNEPELLILDEPTAGVDIEIRHGLWKFLKQLNEAGTTIILTTHYLEEAEQLCKHLAIIDHGEIIEHSTVKSLISRLNVQTLILDMETLPLDLSILNEFVPRHIDETSIEVEIRPDQSINDLFALLTQHHLNVRNLRNKTNRLEELFIRLITDNKRKKESGQ